MDVWLMYLGEVVWRICATPQVLEEDTRDERFCFRSYGVLTAIIFMALVVLTFAVSGDHLFAFMKGYDALIGAERVAFQIVFYSMVAIVIGVPLLLMALVVVAGAVGTAVWFFSLLVALMRLLLGAERKYRVQPRRSSPLRRARISRRRRPPPKGVSQ